MKKLIVIFFLIISTAWSLKAQDQIIPDHFLYIGEETCTAILPNYLDSVIITDNCGLREVTQVPPAGTILDAANPQHIVTITAIDEFNNSTSTSFMVTLLDTITPRIEPINRSYTLGNTEVFGSKANTTQRRAVPYYPTNDGIMSHINIYHGASDTTRMILGVYTDKDGKPDALIAKTLEVAMNGIEGWQRVPVIYPAAFKSGKLWISFNSDGTSEFRYGTGNPTEFGRVAASTDYTLQYGMPELFGPISGDPSSAVYSVYLEYTRGIVVYSPAMINDMYNIVENYIAGEVEDFTHEFDWSTYAIDTVFYSPYSKPMNTIY